MHPPPGTNGDLARKRQAACLSLAIGLLVLSLKGSAYFLTGSTAILSDALESTVNVIAAALLLWSISLAARPADPTHPYGHGKAELFSAAVEGAMIAVAAAMILLEAGRALLVGPEIRRLDLGLGLLAAASAVNAALGAYLVAMGRRTDSQALVADGRHVWSDVWTSLGVVGGLAATHWTGWTWLDPLIAIGLALHLGRVAASIISRAGHSLMDGAERSTLERIADALEDCRQTGWVDVHSLRAWRSGDVHHIDLHLVVPRYFSVEVLHQMGDDLQGSMLERAALSGEVIVHFDPCRPRDCSACEVAQCPVRSRAFSKREPFTVERCTRADMPI